MYMPLNFGSVMTRLQARVEAESAYTQTPFWLSDEKSLWGSDLYLAVERDIAGLENVTLSGTYLTKVFEGPFKSIGTWIPQMEAYVKEKGKTVKKLYFYYSACPKCAKKFGKNYVVIFAQVSE
jgi:hypothetical protein